MSLLGLERTCAKGEKCVGRKYISFSFPSLPPWKIKIREGKCARNLHETRQQFTTLSAQKSPPTTTTTSRLALSYTRSPPSRPVAVASKPSSRSVIFVPPSQPNFFEKTFPFCFIDKISPVLPSCVCASQINRPLPFKFAKVKFKQKQTKFSELI